MRAITNGWAVFALGLALGACSFPSGEELAQRERDNLSGGQARPFDAAAPAPLEVPISEPTFAEASPTSWRGIYRDFFGRRAVSSCAGSGTCHDSATRAGAKISNFICADVDACWQSLRTAKDPDPRVSLVALVEQADVANPEAAYLFKVIRYRTADGTLVQNRGMPQAPRDFAYKPEAITRMQAWIRAGAQND